MLKNAHMDRFTYTYFEMLMEFLLQMNFIYIDSEKLTDNPMVIIGI